MSCPPNYEQGDGSDYQWENCGPSVQTDAIMYEHGCADPGDTRGPWPPTAARIRTLMQDTSGGTTLAQNDAVATEYYETDMDVRYRIPWGDVLGWLDDGWFVSLSVGYGPVREYLDGDPYFNGNHQIGALGDRQYAGGEACRLAFDPLRDGRRAGIGKGTVLVPEAALKRAAAALRFPTRTGGYTLGSVAPGTAYAAKNPTPRGAAAPRPTGIQYGSARMIDTTGLGITSPKYKLLRVGQAIYNAVSAHDEYLLTRIAKPQLGPDGTYGPRVKLNADGEPYAVRVDHFGDAAVGWDSVQISTRAASPDGAMRTWLAFVPEKAGIVGTKSGW